MALDTIAFFKNIRQTLDAMSDADAGALMKALFAHDDGEDVDLSDASAVVRAVFPLMAESTDRLTKKRQNKVRVTANEPQTDRKRTANEPQTDRKRTANEPQTDRKRTAHNHNHIATNVANNIGRWNAPTAQEVQTYCTEQGYTVDAERFVSFYSSKGWMVGKNHMKDWHAACRTWHLENKNRTGHFANERSVDYDAIVAKEA